MTLQPRYIAIAGAGLLAYFYMARKGSAVDVSSSGSTVAVAGPVLMPNPTQGAGQVGLAGYPVPTDQQGSIIYGHAGPTPTDVVNAGNTSSIPSVPLSAFHHGIQQPAWRGLSPSELAAHQQAAVVYAKALPIFDQYAYWNYAIEKLHMQWNQFTTGPLYNLMAYANYIGSSSWDPSINAAVVNTPDNGTQTLASIFAAQPDQLRTIQAGIAAGGK